VSRTGACGITQVSRRPLRSNAEGLTAFLRSSNVANEVLCAGSDVPHTLIRHDYKLMRLIPLSLSGVNLMGKIGESVKQKLLLELSNTKWWERIDPRVHEEMESRLGKVMEDLNKRVTVNFLIEKTK
jgi:hypothetical protein